VTGRERTSLGRRLVGRDLVDRSLFDLGRRVGRLVNRGLLAVPVVRAEEHPDMDAARQSLEAARDHLKAAGHEYGGHRKTALERVNQALEQIRLGLASAGSVEKKVERREQGLQRREQRIEKRIDNMKQRQQRMGEH